jgi:hypothetical protein
LFKIGLICIIILIRHWNKLEIFIIIQLLYLISLNPSIKQYKKIIVIFNEFLYFFLYHCYFVKLILIIQHKDIYIYFYYLINYWSKVIYYYFLLLSIYYKHLLDKNTVKYHLSSMNFILWILIVNYLLNNIFPNYYFYYSHKVLLKVFELQHNRIYLLVLL